MRSSLVALGWCVAVAAALLLATEFHRSHPAPAGEIAAARTFEPSSVPAPPRAAAYVGNTNTHRFHRASCRYASCPNCTARFATREEALRAGYRPCGICDP